MVSAAKYFAFFITLSFFFNISADAISQDLINKICNKSKDPEFCLRVFGKDERVIASPELQVAGAYTFLLIRTYVDATLKFIVDVEKTIKDEVGRTRIRECRADYTWTSDQLREMWDEMIQKKATLFELVLAIIRTDEYTTKCERAYQKLPVTVSPIKDFEKDLANLKEIMMIIYDVFRRS